MSKILRTTQDLPKLFNLEKYRDMDKLNPFEWLLLLRHRIYIYDQVCVLEEGGPFTEEELNFFITCNPSEEINKLLENPLNLIDSFYTLKAVSDWNDDDLDESIIHLTNEATVRELSVSDYQELEMLNICAQVYLNIESNQSICYPVAVNFMQYCTEARTQYGIFNKMPWESNKDNPYTNTLLGGYYPTLINPFSNDEQLVNDLLSYVHKLREDLNIDSTDYLTVDFQNLQKWASYQILPIMDLMIWSKSQDAKITNSVMCVAVFPTGIYGESNLAKSIFPLINDFFDCEHNSKQIKALSRFVASEIRKNSDKYFPENKWAKTDWNEFTKGFIAHWLPIKHSEKSS